MTSIILLIYALASAGALVLLKLGSATGAPFSIIDGKPHFNLGLYVIAGIILYGVSFIIYTYLISKNDLGYIIPVSTALVYVGIFLASYFIFKESFTALKITAISMIVLGVILLSLNK